MMIQPDIFQDLTEEGPKPHKPQVLFTEKQFNAANDYVSKKGKKLSTYMRELLFAEMLGTSKSMAIKNKSIDLVVASISEDDAICRDNVERQVICSEHPQGERFSYIEIKDEADVVPKGALALIERKQWVHGQVVAVRIRHNKECVLSLRRVLINDKREIELRPENANGKLLPIVLTTDKNRPGYITLSPDDAEIVGVFTGDYIFRAPRK